MALGFKENGNEMVKAKRWKDGRDFYSQALGVLHRNAPVQTQTGNAIDLAPDSTSVVDQDAEHQEEKKIEEACYVNRAFCNLELRTSSPLPNKPSKDPNPLQLLRKLSLHHP